MPFHETKPSDRPLDAHRAPGPGASRPSSADALRAQANAIGVRVFLLILLCASAVIPLALLGLSEAARWARNEVRSADRQAETAARSLAGEVSLSMVEYVHATATLAMQMGARGVFDRATAFSVLGAYTNLHPELLGTYLTDSEGRSLANHVFGATPVAGTTVYSDRDYFREAVRTRAPVISKVQQGRVSQMLAINIGAPYYDDRGAFRGIACSSINLESLREQALGLARGMVNGRVMLIDRDGQTIADSSASEGAELKQAADVALFAPMPSGEVQVRVGRDDKANWVRAVAVGLTAPVAGWRAIAMVPQSTIDFNARQVQYRTVLFSLVLAIVSFGLAAWAAGWLSRPLRNLAAYADEVSRGALTSAPQSQISAPREVIQLTEAVCGMVESLRSYSVELESQVATRTQELSLANQDLTRALVENRQNSQRVREDIDQARLFQEKCLPQLPQSSGLTVAAAYLPLEVVSGDIYDVARLPSGGVRIFLADATGHGVQAAMRTMMLAAGYDRIKTTLSNPREVLAALNTDLVSHFPDGDLHCTASCIDIVPSDSQGWEVIYSNAGNPPLTVFDPCGQAVERYADGPLMGLAEIEWPSSMRFEFVEGQCLLIATDGICEQWNEEKVRFEEVMPEAALPTQSAAGLVDAVLARLERFRGRTPIRDDITVIAVRAQFRCESTPPSR